MKLGKEYLEELKSRGKKSKIYRKYQLIGLQIAEILGDEKHKALYIKLAKNGNTAKLVWLAADVADRKGVKNRGAYFMTLLQISKQPGTRPAGSKQNDARNRYHRK